VYIAEREKSELAAASMMWWYEEAIGNSYLAPASGPANHRAVALVLAVDTPWDNASINFQTSNY
jgi:hypothetical protein